MNGRIFDGRYWKVKANDHPSVCHLKPKYRYVREERLIMEERIGRYLTSDEFVCVKDGKLILTDRCGQNKVFRRVKDYLTNGGDRNVFINKAYL